MVAHTTYTETEHTAKNHTGLPGVILPQRYRIIGNYHTAADISFSLSTSVVSADTLYAVPFIVPGSQTFDRIAVNVAIASTTGGDTARLGIYADAGGYPGALVLDAGIVDVTAIAVVEIVINQTLSDGLYWLVVAIDDGTTMTLRALGVTGSVGQRVGGFNFFGYPATLPVTSGRAYRVAFVYDVLPANFPGGATILTEVDGCPLVYLRRSA